MVLMTYDRFAILPKRCDYCNRLFWLEPYNIRYREVGTHGTIELCECTRLHFKEVKMATRIIKNTMTEPQEITCPSCGSIFTYTFEDIKRISPPFAYIALYGCEANKFRAVICPVCKRNVELDRVVIAKEDNNND